MTAPLALPRAARAIIVATLVGGTAGTIAVITADQGPLHMDTKLWLVAGVVGLLNLYNWAQPILVYRANQSQSIQFDEGFLVVLALLVPPAVTVGVFGAGVLIGQVARRRRMLKLAFNSGEALFSLAAALLVSRAIAVPGKHLSPEAVAAAGLGAGMYFCLTTGLVSLLIVSMGAHWREAVSQDIVPQMGSSAVGTLVGVLIAIDIEVDGWAVALAVPLLVTLRLLVSAQFKAQHDRARMQGLFNLTLDANRRLREEAVLDSVLQSAREQLRCMYARLTTTAPEPDEMAAAIDIGGRSQWMVVSGRRKEEPFDQADQMLLDAISAIAAGALTNAELYRQVRFERGRLASVTLNIGEGVCAIDAEGALTFVNPAAADLVRLPARSRAIGETMPAESLQAPDFLLAPARAVMHAGGVVREEEAWFEGRDGKLVQVAYTASAVRHNGEVVGAVIAFRDITERKKLEATMAHQAMYDSLTGLANRRLLVERLEAALERSQLDGRSHALIFVDVDRFKAINDSLGHGTGDGLLVAVGNRMKEAVGSRALLARFGGDEFVLLMEDVDNPEEAVSAARRICSAVEEPLVLPDGYEIVASLSVGIALTEPGQTADDALRDADVAMYRAKGRGGTFQLFDKTVMGTRSSERIDLESALRKGIERGELELYYQPLVSVEDQKIVGAEALVRWRHPAMGLISPDTFIPMAEETGLILPLGRFVLEQACREIASIRERLGVDLPISVNLSPRQFQQNRLLTDVAAALDRVALPSHLLKFEITETMVMDDLAGATEIMKKLNRLGVRLAIDDFGTGHSSLGYLKNFPVHEVKVDHIFVNNLAHDPVDSAIVRAVVDLADAMRIVAVAEGVETKEQLSNLQMLGCHVAQGFLFSRPLPVEEFDEMLDGHLRPKPTRVRTSGLRAV